MRGHIDSKSNTCTESLGVDAAGISVKVGVSYPERCVSLPWVTVIERCQDGLTEVSRGHSRSPDRTEGPNMNYRTGA